VSVPDARDAEDAIRMVHNNMLNGCYPPGEVVYPCESYISVEAKKVAKRIRDTKARNRADRAEARARASPSYP
jgi:hypothetical protein